MSYLPASPAYGVYILQLVRYSRACAQRSVFLDRAQLLTQKLLKRNYVTPRLKSSLKQFHGRHHDLVDNYEIFISQMTMESFTFYVDAFCPLSGKLHTLVMLEYCY
jgi:hypothetical protein